MIELSISTSKKNELIDITDRIKKVIKKEQFEYGLVFIYVPHTTAAITINEGADPSVKHDIIHTLEQFIPESNDYHHMEGNSDAHIKASLLGSSVTVIIKNKKLMLGTWQHIFFYEGDGPRNRKVYIDIVK